MTTHRHSDDFSQFEAVRQACLGAAVDAYEDAGIRGLCGDGRWEAALDAVRTLDLRAVVERGRPAAAANTIRLKRIYEPKAASDGVRILVDRLWPRGLRRDKAAIDAWLPDVAPSAALRRWFGHVPSRWAEFQRRFAAELDARPDAVRALVAQIRKRRRATLLFAARDVEHNNAVALRAYLQRRFDV